MILHGYFRSSAAFRVRIALNMKGISYATASHHLVHNDQRSPDYLAINPQGLVPALETQGTVLTQSLAICEYLEETRPEPPLLPADPLRRARVRAFALAIACDIHPLQNLRVQKKLRFMGHDKAEVNRWALDVIEEGLDACAALIADEAGPFCFGSAVTLADIVLVPQLANARRFGAEMRWPKLLAIEAACLELDAFRNALPENQPDAE